MGKIRTPENAKPKRRGVGYFTDVTGKEIYFKAYDEVMGAMTCTVNSGRNHISLEKKGSLRTDCLATGKTLFG